MTSCSLSAGQCPIYHLPLMVSGHVEGGGGGGGELDAEVCTMLLAVLTGITF